MHSLKGSVGALAIGVVGLLLGGLGIVGATQNAFQQVWHIPRKRRPNFLTWRLRGIGLLAVLGVLLVVSTVAAGYVTAQTAGDDRRCSAGSCSRWRRTCCCSSPRSGS